MFNVVEIKEKQRKRITSPEKKLKENKRKSPPEKQVVSRTF